MDGELVKIGDLEAGVMAIYDIPKHIRLEDGYFVIDYGGYDYDIAKEQIETPEQLIGWLLHLSEKRWMDTSRLRYFANLVAHTNNFKFEGMDSE